MACTGIQAGVCNPGAPGIDVVHGQQEQHQQYTHRNEGRCLVLSQHKNRTHRHQLAKVPGRSYHQEQGGKYAYGKEVLVYNYKMTPAF